MLRDHFHGIRMVDSNCYLFIAMDPIFKWVETQAVPSLYSWRVTKYLYNNVVACWGKLCYILIDKGAKFVGSFIRLCKGVGIIHHHITVGNSKANG